MSPFEKDNPPLIHLAILASGSGSNAYKICEHLNKHAEIRVVAILSNKENSGVKAHAQTFGIPFIYHSNQEFESGEKVISTLKKLKVQGVILAGFLRKIPLSLLQSFPNRLINIHPALLPKYGGKGMYGSRVHQAVKEAGEKYSGPTIHLVNENYDEGRILFQAKVKIEAKDSPEEIGAKVLSLEHIYYPRIIESYFVGLGKKV